MYVMQTEIKFKFTHLFLNSRNSRQPVVVHHRLSVVGKAKVCDGQYVMANALAVVGALNPRGGANRTLKAL